MPKTKKQKPFPVVMGVKNLTEEAANDLFNAMSKHFGWSGVIFNRSDVEDSMERELTDDEWSRVRASWPWRKGLPEILCERGWDLVAAAKQEAGIKESEDEDA